jgi:hypothetical protein
MEMKKIERKSCELRASREQTALLEARSPKLAANTKAAAGSPRLLPVQKRKSVMLLAWSQTKALAAWAAHA